MAAGKENSLAGVIGIQKSIILVTNSAHVLRTGYRNVNFRGHIDFRGGGEVGAPVERIPIARRVYGASEPVVVGLTDPYNNPPARPEHRVQAVCTANVGRARSVFFASSDVTRSAFVQRRRSFGLHFYNTRNAVYPPLPPVRVCTRVIVSVCAYYCQCVSVYSCWCASISLCVRAYFC